MPLDEVVHPATIAYAEWSPVSHSLAFVKANDIYVVTAGELDRIGTDRPPRTTRVTYDGSETKLNGVPDWVYEEEVGGQGGGLHEDRTNSLTTRHRTGLQHQLCHVVVPAGGPHRLSQER